MITGGCDSRVGRAPALRWLLMPAIGAALVIAANGAAVAAPSQNAQTRSGAELYNQYCVLCHGADLTGYAADNAPSLVSPTFRETVDDAFLRSAIQRGRAGTAMGGYGTQFGGPLTIRDVNELIAYLRGGAKPKPLPARPSRGNAANGEQVYRTHCASCHGTPSQRANAVHLANSMFLETASDSFLRDAIVRGRPGTPMEAWGHKLSAAQTEDVVAYLRSLARSVPPPPAAAAKGVPPIENGPIVINPDGEQANFTLRDGRFVSVADVAKAYQEKRRLVIVDARSPADYLRVHITGAISIPHFDMRDVDKVPKDGTWIVTYCACPHHASVIVMEEFRKRGYANAAVLDEGIFAWQTKGYPTIVAPGQLPIAAPPVNPVKSP